MICVFGFVFLMQFYVVASWPQRDLIIDLPSTDLPSIEGNSSNSVPSGQYNDVRQLSLEDNPTYDGYYSLFDSSHLWPNGNVPYMMSSNLSDDQQHQIQTAMNDITAATCLRFSKCASCSNKVVFLSNDSSCYSQYLGRMSMMGVHRVNFGNGCWKKGTILHVIMHVLGFYHELLRPDRDQYVTVVWDNIIPIMRNQFEKYNGATVGMFDYHSIMMYGVNDNHISRNGSMYILATNQSMQSAMGQRDGLSPEDIRKINLAYCSAHGTATATQSTAITYSTKSTTSAHSDKHCQHTFECPAQQMCNKSSAKCVSSTSDDGSDAEEHLPGQSCTKQQVCPQGYHCHLDESTCYRII